VVLPHKRWRHLTVAPNPSTRSRISSGEEFDRTGLQAVERAGHLHRSGLLQLGDHLAVVLRHAQERTERNHASYLRNRTLKKLRSVAAQEPDSAFGAIELLVGLCKKQRVLGRNTSI